MTTAWAAIVISAVGVTVSAAVVVTNVFAVRRAARTQLQIARDQRISDRQSDTYIDLLLWVREMEADKRDLGLLDLAEKLKLPDDLDVRTTAFASKAVRQRVKEFVDVWFRLHRKTQHDRERIWALASEAIKTKDRTALLAAVPELDAMPLAATALRDSIRRELLGDDLA
jgi:hypothetical protein